jgi:hypothetical protein
MRVRDTGTLYIAFNALWEAASEDREGALGELLSHEELRNVLPESIMEAM